MNARANPAPNAVTVRSLSATDLDTADHIMRLAFGTFLGLPEPEKFMGDANYVRTRWAADPTAAFAAAIDGELVGSNFATAWGSIGFFGPLTTHPTVWDQGIGRRLIGPALECLKMRGVQHLGLFTFSNSPKHIALYQRYGFWPRFLTLLLSKPALPRTGAPTYSCLSSATSESRSALVADCATCTDALHDGLDVSHEIRSVADQKLGDTILLASGDRVEAFAVCHVGPNTEAGSGSCYIKFAAVRPGTNAAHHFLQLIHACEHFASNQGAQKLVVGVNTACIEATQCLLIEGFRVNISGISMHTPNESAYCRPGVYACSDWR